MNQKSSMVNLTMTSNVIIIGGGPAGLTAAIYSARAGLTPIVAAGGVSGGLMPGGQLMITTEVENYPGFPGGVTGPELMTKFRQQALSFNTIIVDEWAKDIQKTDRGTFTMTIGDKLYETKSVIIATGAVAKWLNLPKEDDYKNNGISACATCDGPLPCFRGKHLHVVGGGDTAMEEASFLTKFASKVTIIHRRDTLRASKYMQELALANEKIEFLFDSTITEYVGDPISGLTALKIENVKTAEVTEHPTAGLFMGIGHKPMTDFLKGFVDTDTQGYVKTQDTVYTSVPGIFTCGDVHDHVYRQAITAAGFGCMAAIATERWLEQNKTK
jgi:thioredoxin reductase (NADPH)